MYVYSGKCRLCECGLATEIRDIGGNVLRTGDIVISFTDTYTPSNLTVVVSDQFQSYTDGRHEQKDGDQVFFVMGIKNVPIHEGGEWQVLRVKEYTDVLDGEHWPAYGFRFSET
jgi:hypothetical protein